jgi:hypothetical protein
MNRIEYICYVCPTPCKLSIDARGRNAYENIPDRCPYGRIRQTLDSPLEDPSEWDTAQPQCDMCEGYGEYGDDECPSCEGTGVMI